MLLISKKAKSLAKHPLKAMNLLWSRLHAKGVSWAALLAISVFFLSVIFVLLTLDYTSSGTYSSLFDDAMISMRYARNIAHGLGPYWNASDKVEGFTNPFWTYLMSTVYFLTGSNDRAAPVAIQILSAGFLSSNCYAFAIISGKLKFQAGTLPVSGHKLNLLWIGASLSPVLFYPNVYWSLMGMEVALLTVISSLIFIIVFEDEIVGQLESTCSSSIKLFFVFIACAVGQSTRPDFLLFPVSVLAVKLITRRNAGSPQYLQFSLSALAGLLLGICTIAIWRIHYFGTIVPNTYLLKVKGVDIGIQLASGFGFVAPMLAYYLCFLILSLYILITRKRYATPLYASVVYFIVSLAYQIRVGGDPWSYWRVFSTAFVLMSFSSFVALMPRVSSREALFNIEGPPKVIALRSYFHSALPHLLWISILISNFNFLKTDLIRPLKASLINREPFSVYQVADNRQNIKTAKFLSRILPKKSKIAVFWAGTIPYYMPEYYAVDFLGKSDKYIASLADRGGPSWGGMKTVPGHNKYDLNWTLDTYFPDWIQYSEWGKDNLQFNKKFTDSYSYCSKSKGFLKNKFMALCNS